MFHPYVNNTLPEGSCQRRGLGLCVLRDFVELGWGEVGSGGGLITFLFLRS